LFRFERLLAREPELAAHPIATIRALRPDAKNLRHTKPSKLGEDMMV
jgi:hypothetical protein